MQCAHCGADLRDGARFCDRCGMALVQGAPVPPPPSYQNDDELRAVIRQMGSQLPPPPPDTARVEPVRQGNVVPGIIAVVVGIFLVIIGLSPELSCGVVRAVGGQCIVLFGNLAIQSPYGSVPTIVLAIGAMAILIGAIDAYMVSGG